jgi:hypothetical protein
MMFSDSLRPPPPFDLQAAAYKDWLHLNLLDHASGRIGVINVSLHGTPGDPRSRAVGTALVHVPGAGWIGNLEIRGMDEAAIGPASIGLEHVAVAIDTRSGTVLASVRDPENDLALHVTARMATAPIIVEQPLPLGHGWISWTAVPRLTVTGEWIICDVQSDLSTAGAYHDHNWGRWYWGDDLGWEWGCFLTPATVTPPKAVVFSLTTDRTHHQTGQPALSVIVGQKRQTFRGSALQIDYEGRLDMVERRVPGALAALHQDHAHVHLPRRITIRADDGRDCITLEFNGHSAAQLITGDPIMRGYNFIHEIAGEFRCAGWLGEVEVSGAGLGVFEYVC